MYRLVERLFLAVQRGLYGSTVNASSISQSRIWPAVDTGKFSELSTHDKEVAAMAFTPAELWLSTAKSAILRCMTRQPDLVSRPVQPDDFEAIAELLVDTVPIAPVGFNWDIRRWQGRRFYDARDGGDPHWNRDGRLWQLVEGPVIAVVFPEGPGSLALQVHPDFRYLENDLVTWSEAQLAGPAQDGRGRQIQVFVYDYDAHRQQLLAGRGFEQMPYGGVTRHLRLGYQPLAEPSLATGYILRTTKPEDPADAQRIADLLNAAFNRDFHNAAEYQQFTRQAACFRPELDLVAVAPDGTFAAYAGIPYDQTNRRGIFEPVCTHPQHRQRGLAKSLMQEGLIRLRALGATNVIVDTGDMIPANRLYSSLGFGEMYKGHYWRKLLT